MRIATHSSISEITKPVKAKAIDLVWRCIVKVLDDEGRWHVVGHCFLAKDAEKAVNRIDYAIKHKKEKVDVNIS